MPSEGEAVFRRQLTHITPADYRPRAERANLLRYVEVKLHFAANDMNPHSRIPVRIFGRAGYLKTLLHF